MPEISPAFLADQGVRFVRVLWCDNGNVIRAKAIHVGALTQHWHKGVGLSVAQQAVPVMVDAPAADSGLGPVGEVWLVPDEPTLTVLPYAPSHARVLGNMMQAGQPWPWCPRNFLRRMVQAAADLDLQVQAAFENEFYLLKQTGDRPLPADETPFAASLAIDLHQPVIDAIADALIAQNIAVEQYYPESGPGQQEISVRYASALAAADQQIAFRETVRAIARQHHLMASFLPKVFENSAGSGCHLHLSLWQEGNNILPNGQGALSDVAQAFIAGILRHLPALMLLTAPSTNSYRRLRPHLWSGAFRAWGYDNREAAIRVPTNPAEPSPTHFELKTVDGSANPYLALGSVIAAGLEGVRQKLSPPHPVEVDPGLMPEAEQIRRGIDRLPTHLKLAIEHFRQDTCLMAALGEPLAQTYLAVRQAEWEAMHSLSFDEEVKLLLDRY
ncbi:glutamine synthetase family protein [Almyronema epifaneia]|uniref:Glutamine synthetase family protein n=1 Tax=Almyronema epifaneia S1 TaxID=2991925 RepID=A0ABW6IGQ1_9CYAN